MTIYFSAETIYNYIFSKMSDCNDIFEIEKSKVFEFCNVLEDELVKLNIDHVYKYKYVVFGLGREVVDEFFQNNRQRFLDFGNTVLFVQTPTFEMANSIEAKYGDKIVIDALRKARFKIRNL